jgi:dihydroorotate dehydrogenase
MVGIGTSLFADPDLPRRVLQELPELLRRHDAEGIRELVGAAHPPVSSSTRA